MHVRVRNPVRHIDPVPGAASPPELYEPSPHAAAWAIIEDEPDATGSPPPPRSRVDRRACLVLAIAGAVVGFGFVGGSGRPSPADANADPDADARRAGITLSAPVADAEVAGGVVEVAGVARRAAGRLRLEVRAAGVAIGAVDVNLTSAGPFRARIPVLAPATRVRAELVGTLAGDSAEAVEPAIRRALTLQPAGPVAAWTAEVTRSDRGAFVTLTGAAAVALRRVQLEVSSRDGGSPLAAARARIGLEEEVPGAAGGWSLGVGTFRARLRLPAPHAAEPLRVTISWRDDAAGSWGSMWVDLPGRPGPRR